MLLGLGGMSRRHLARSTSRNLQGNLCDVSVGRLLEICAYHRVTGILRIQSWGLSGAIALEDGSAGEACFQSLRGDRALGELVSLRDGMFELRSQVPISLDAPIGAEASDRRHEAAERPGHEASERPDSAGQEALAAPVSMPGSQAPGHAPSGVQWPSAQTGWPYPDWTPPRAHVGWPAGASMIESVTLRVRRSPALKPVLGIGLLCLTLLVGIVAL